MRASDLSGPFHRPGKKKIYGNGLPTLTFHRRRGALHSLSSPWPRAYPIPTPGLAPGGFASAKPPCVKIWTCQAVLCAPQIRKYCLAWLDFHTWLFG